MQLKLILIVKWIWIICIILCLSFYIYKPSLFTKESITFFIGGFKTYAWYLYFLIHIVRGLVLLPSTPLIFAGVLLFPDRLMTVLIISLVGILSCSLMIYFFSDKLGFSNIFKKKNKQLNYIEQKLISKNNFYYILLWAFLPIVPTDLICYVSGALKVKLPVFITSILLGELILCFIYIFGSSFIIN